MLTTMGLHHRALRVTDRARAAAFFSTDIVGLQPLLERDDLVLLSGHSVLLSGHGVLLRLRATTDRLRDDHFTSTRVGIDHRALGVADRATLEHV